MILGDNPAGIKLFQISHNCVTECTLQANFFIKTYLSAIRDTFFPICGISQYMIFLSNRRGKLKLSDLQGDSSTTQFPRLVRYPDLPMRKTLRVVGLLTVMIFFQSKKLTACKIKDEKEETSFYFLMVFDLLKIIHPFESKKHFRT